MAEFHLGCRYTAGVQLGIILCGIQLLNGWIWLLNLPGVESPHPAVESIPIPTRADHGDIQFDFIHIDPTEAGELVRVLSGLGGHGDPELHTEPETPPNGR